MFWYMLFWIVDRRSFVKSVQLVPRCSNMYSSCHGGHRMYNKESGSPKEKGKNVTALLQGIFGWKLDPCNSAAWHWQVCLILFWLSSLFHRSLSQSMLILSVNQVCCGCICNFLYGKMGEGETWWSHAK